eukprot:1155447-Pelagomonas_calceolata.AAC.1
MQAHWVCQPERNPICCVTSGKCNSRRTKQKGNVLYQCCRPIGCASLRGIPSAASPLAHATAEGRTKRGTCFVSAAGPLGVPA